LGCGLLAAVAACAPLPARRARTALIVTGHGWGHGVGMSQWGAYGYALHGWKYRRILAHYYPGTKMSRSATRVRVLLTQGPRRSRRLRHADASSPTAGG
jgi:stage II sporulation protein D